MKLPLGDLNPDLCPPYPTNIYTCGVTTAPKVHGGTTIINFNIKELSYILCCY